MNPFDLDGLWLKSKLFVNKSFDPDRDFEERAFWACSALELLGKAALAQVSPLLVANPMDDGKSLIVASGIGATAEATSIQGKTVWIRCGKIFRPFNETEVRKLTLGRNEYIHSAGLGFDQIPSTAWWPRYWAQAVILLQHLGRDLHEWVGSPMVATVNSHLATRRDNLANQLEARLERARSTLRQFESNTLSARAATEWGTWSIPRVLYEAEIECPACGGAALLLSNEKLTVDVDYEHIEADTYDLVSVNIEAATEQLNCLACHLAIADYDLLTEANVPLTFHTSGDLDDIEYESEYNNE